ncbi:MAG: Gfo/Idh/MocA family oxidoreductase [Clostridia bacterium]|jgi:hypothetical protein
MINSRCTTQTAGQDSQKEGQEGQKQKYNVLICGAGNQGALADAPGSGNEGKIISYGHALKGHPGFALVGFYDKNIKKANQAAGIWRTYWCDSLNSGLENVDIAVVSTPDSTHYEILKQLAEYPLKLVICEKPICSDLQQAREIVELYRQKNIPILVNYTRRFLPYYQELKRRYEAGEFGELISWNLKFNRGLLHTGSHMVDFLQWLIGYQLEGLSEVRPEANYRIWQMDLFFEKYHWREERIGDMPVWPYYDKTHWHLVDNAYQFLEGREPLRCTAEDALRTLEICFELMEGK